MLTCFWVLDLSSFVDACVFLEFWSDLFIIATFLCLGFSLRVGSVGKKLESFKLLLSFMVTKLLVVPRAELLIPLIGIFSFDLSDFFSRLDAGYSRFCSLLGFLFCASIFPILTKLYFSSIAFNSSSPAFFFRICTAFTGRAICFLSYRFCDHMLSTVS